MDKVVPNYSIFYKFPNVYDFLIYLVEKWFIDPLSDLAVTFTSLFTEFLQGIFNFDADFWHGCNTVFANVSQEAYKLIPLIILLNIARLIRKTAASSANINTSVRETIITMIVNIGIALSCGFLAKQFLLITQSFGIEMLKATGLELEIEGNIVKNMEVVTKYVFASMSFTLNQAGLGVAMNTVLIFMRLFMIIVMTLSVGFISVSSRFAVVFLFAISSMVFVISSYEEFASFRDMWLKGFVSISIVPAITGIIFFLMVSMNMDAVEDGVTTAAEAFKVLGISTGLSLILASIHSVILTQILDYSYGTITNIIRSAGKTVKNAVELYAAVQTGGATAAAKSLLGLKGKDKAADTTKKTVDGNKKDSGGKLPSGKNNNADEKSDSSDNSNNGSGSGGTGSSGGMGGSGGFGGAGGSGSSGSTFLKQDPNEGYKNFVKKKLYGMTDEEIADPENDKNKRADKAFADAERVYHHVSDLYRTLYGKGKTITEASQNYSNKDVLRKLNDRGGADEQLLRDMMWTAARYDVNNANNIIPHKFVKENGLNDKDVNDPFFNIEQVADASLQSADYNDYDLRFEIQRQFSYGDIAKRKYTFD